ncbi:hypothetical protein EVAR_31545_1 [Eumeta japonica]|uniref:Uncharacterized protein n=1 Tax=Eumeta variegata TaxID=151549 RepID=A0A4C1V870_EUMVA|nr:hypothetical protein EVAR_31545_1 [Eumeta japonica]
MPDVDHHADEVTGKRKMRYTYSLKTDRGRGGGLSCPARPADIFLQYKESSSSPPDRRSIIYNRNNQNERLFSGGRRSSSPAGVIFPIDNGNISGRTAGRANE